MPGRPTGPCRLASGEAGHDDNTRNVGRTDRRFAGRTPWRDGAEALDGQPMAGAVFLKPGRYAFQPDTATGRLALFWTSAFERGFSPFWK